MQPIVLVAVNARYTHASLGTRYLHANLGALRARSRCVEFVITEEPSVIARSILSMHPALVGMGVYIWNRPVIEGVVQALHAASPDLPVVLGGPEIAHDTESALAQAADCVVCGEGEETFPGVCERLLRGDAVPRVVTCPPPALDRLALPYACYTDEDIAHRVLYVETSRGCPYGCEYCISSLDKTVRRFSLDRLLPVFERLLDRGALRFKFVDRCFNVDADHAVRVLNFFLDRWREGMVLHLEMTPDRIGPGLRDLMCRFPAGGLHVEAGVQTFNAEVANRVGRRADMAAVEEGLRFLVKRARVDVHADLIAGLPGETPDSFQAGFDRLADLGPSELQLGLLKRLHGAPVERHAAEWEMRFSPTPPYKILQTSTMSAEYLDGLRRFAMHWDRVVNRHLLPGSVPMIWQDAPSVFAAFDAFSRKLETLYGRSGFGLVELCRELSAYLVDVRGQLAESVRHALRSDYLDDGRRMHLPAFLR